MPLKIVIQHIDELRQSELLLVVNERFNGRQAVCTADDAEHFAGSIQVTHAAFKRRLAARDAVVQKQTKVQIRRAFARNFIVEVFVYSKAVNGRLELCKHGVIQLFKGIKLCRVAGLFAAGNVLVEIKAVVQRNFQRFQRVDAVVRCAYAVTNHDVFAAAERHILLGFLMRNAKDLFHSRYIRLIGVNNRERGALRIHVHRLAENGLVHVAVIAQGELRHSLAEAAGSFHDDDGEAVGFLLVLSAHAADDYAAVMDLVNLFKVLIEIQHGLHGFFFRDAPRVDIRGVERPKVIVHAAVIHNVAADSVDPHQLHALKERLRCAVLNV